MLRNYAMMVRGIQNILKKNLKQNWHYPNSPGGPKVSRGLLIHPYSGMKQVWEQSNFGDTILSAAMGRPIFQGAWSYQGDLNRIGVSNSTWNTMHAHFLIRRHHQWNGELTTDLKLLSRCVLQF